MWLDPAQGMTQVGRVGEGVELFAPTRVSRPIAQETWGEPRRLHSQLAPAFRSLKKARWGEKPMFFRFAVAGPAVFLILTSVTTPADACLFVGINPVTKETASDIHSRSLGAT